MGCDIHMYVEKKKADGTWKAMDKWVEEAEDDEPSYWNADYNSLVYNGRNYNLFAILANVRNGYGFAGCDTGEGFVPISEPKGLPDDVTEEVKRCSDQWDCDGHSHSYLTLKELLDYDWLQTATLRGVIRIGEYEKWRYWKGQPSGSWCGGISGHNVKMVSNEEADHILATRKDVTNDNFIPRYYTKVSWEKLYVSCCERFYIDTLGKLQEMSDDGEGRDVRVVFWFDN